MAAKKKPQDPYKCDQWDDNKRSPNYFKHYDGEKTFIDRWFLDWFKTVLEKVGIMSTEANCRFPWLVPWPIGTKFNCCPKKKELPVVNPLEVQCAYKPLVKACQIWIFLVRGTTVPKWAQIKRCVGEPCRR